MTDPRYCCDMLRAHGVLSCAKHGTAHDCPDVLLVWSDRWQIWSLPIRDGGGSYVEVQFCPWCAADLPVRPCPCGDTGWTDDENWQPEYHEIGQGRRPGSGRIPCGFCNFGDWSKPDPVTEPDEFARWQAAGAV